tara:strand:- start:3988 stop:15597 length:11610 start_codon:yes stop_codon:yes gene_type:complete
MSLNDLFGQKSNKLITAQDAENTSNDVESKDLVRAEVARRKTFIPKIDFSDPKNFARYGQAEKYYVDTIQHIYQTYPYDGSKAEQIEWHNNASYVDNYLFDNGYPRTTGYVTLNTTYAIGNTVSNPSSSGETFNSASVPQYITFKGGPHSASADAAEGVSLTNLFGDSKTNIYKISDNRSSNLDLSYDLGNTIEFWYKVDSTSSFLDQSTCIFDAWNNEDLTSDSYGRILVEVLGSGSGDGTTFPTTGSFTVSYLSGSTGANRIHVGSGSAMPSDWAMTDWHHYAFTFKSDTSVGTTKVKFYVDGNLVTETTSGTTAIASSIDRGWVSTIGAYREAPIVAATSSVSEGYGTYPTASYDEFRFWRQARTEKEIKQNWFTQVRGGTNTDDANIELGVYYKFNEGTVNTSSIDSTDAKVLDYSGRISNGNIENYSLAVRSSGSALTNEYKDPIIYLNNYRVVDYKSSLESKGHTYDLGNHTSIMNSIPKWITDADEHNNSTVLKNLVQILSSYFDTLHLQIEALPHIKDVHYPSLQSGSFPYHFIQELVGSSGIINPDLFIEANVIEEITSRDETQKYSQNIQDIKNVIYQNIYNNLSHILKTKGTEKSFRNLLHCFGIDNEILKINMYANNVDFVFNSDNSYSATHKKQYLNFNNTSSFGATVYQQTDSSNSNSTSYMASQSANQMDHVPYTAQCEVFFPKKFSSDVTDKFHTPFTQVSLFGMHEATASVSDLTWAPQDIGNFQVYFIKPNRNSKGGYFKLEYSGSINLTSSFIENVYDNEKWNLAVRFRPSGSILLGTNDITSTYQLEFYGVNSVSNVVQNEFHATSVISDIEAKKALNASRRVYVGAHKTNFTGSTLYQSDVHISSVRFWNDYLDNSTIKWHSYDASTHGRQEPYKSAFLVKSLTGSKGGIFIPQIETLALHWNFQNLSSADSSGQLTVLDCSSGSNISYDWYSDLSSKHHTGQGSNFPVNYSKAVRHKYINTLKTSQPGILNNSDMINILTRDDETFTRDTVPIQYYFSIEKSMYQTLSDEILKIFTGLKYFNDLIGHPINRYRVEYKDLRKLRQLFFTGVQNTPSLEKYVDFYKWIDSSVAAMIQELFPASANFSDNIQTMVESHILERNKYWNKFPTIEDKSPDPDGIVTSPHYDWVSGYHPPGTTNPQNCLWWRDRVERTDPLVTSGNDEVDANREVLRKVIVRGIHGPATIIVGGEEIGPLLYDQVEVGSYEQNTYFTRRKPSPTLTTAIDYNIKGGTNFHFNKLPPFEFTRNATSFGTTDGIIGQDAVVIDNCKDGADRYDKFKADSKSRTGEPSGFTNSAKGSLLNPFSEYIKTVTTGTPEITNNLFDSYGKDKETPAQGPFTDTHVGGASHRHIELNRGTTLDTATIRPELYIDSNTSDTATNLVHPAHSDADIPSARYFRDETAKRSINIRNIKYTTASFNLGNYNKDYQIISSPGRSMQNRWLVKNEGNVTINAGISSTAVAGLIDFALPDRSTDLLGNTFGNSKHVITEQFSAPGGVDSLPRRCRDAESEEFSPYNSINYRNLIVRQFLNTKHQTHAGPRGYVEGTATGSYHKTQRNTGYRIQLTGTLDSDVQLKASHDNFFITHQIPRSEYQHAWITASAITLTDLNTTGEFRQEGFSSDFLNVRNTASFVLSGSLYAGSGRMDIDFAGTYTTIWDPYDIANLVTGHPNSYDADYVHRFFADPSATVSKAKQLNALLLHRNGPYQYPSWKQIRVGERPLTRELRKNNIITVHEMEHEELNQDGTSRNIGGNVKHFPEPVVTWNLPVRTTVGLDETNKYNIDHSYSNVVEMFANPHLTNITNLYRERKKIYDTLISLYADDDSKINFSSIDYRELIFPKHRNVGFQRTRQRINYKESEDTLKLSPTAIRTFWRSESANRIKTNISFNALDTKFSIPQLNSFKQLDSFWALDNFNTTINSNTYEVLGDLAYVGTRRYDAWISNQFRTHEGSAVTQVTPIGDFASSIVPVLYENTNFIGQNISQDQAYELYSSEFLSRNTTTTHQPGIESSQTLGLTATGVSTVTPLEIVQTPTVQTRDNAPLSSTEPGLGGGLIAETLFYNPNLVLDLGYDNVLDILNIETSGLFYKPPTNYDLETKADDPNATNNIITNNKSPMVPTCLVAADLSTYAPRPAIQFIHNPYYSVLTETGWKWNVSELSEKNPWYDTYEDYSQDLIKIAPNHSILPEFSISKHMRYYVKTKNGDFNTNNHSFLTLDGGGSRLEPKHNSANKQVTFKKEYSRDGAGAFDVLSYPTSSADSEIKNIQNNAWGTYKGPSGDSTYIHFQDKNNTFAAGTFNIDNSVMTVYDIVRTNPSTGKNSAGEKWRSFSPYQQRNAAVMLNTKKDKQDYLTSKIEKINRTNESAISLQQERSSAGGTPFCVSCWVNLDSKANDNSYVGAWNISQGNNEAEQWCGLWLKAPKAKSFVVAGGTATSRGITFFMSLDGHQPGSSGISTIGDNIYEFFNADGTEATLDVGETYHILFEFVPQGTTDGISPAYIRIFLNGNKLYGKHIVYADSDYNLTGTAYSACPIGATGSFGGSTVYGGGQNDYGCNKLTNLEIGKSNPKSVTVESGQYFKGTMDECSMWYGTLTSDDVTRMMYYCQPSNLMEEFLNNEISGVSSDWDAEFGDTAPYIGEPSSVTYTGSIPTSSFSFQSLDLFQWTRLGVPFTIKPDKVQIDYSDKFFDQYCHTDFIKHFDQVTTDHKDLGKKTKLRLKVNAVKKLLPYNGFYPSQRVLQLANLFKESYGDSITLGNPSPPHNRTGQHKSQALQSLLQPFFAPGLLFNTIKSGIAVDFPIFINESGLEPYKPRPFMDAFDQDNTYVSKKIDILAPSWYCNPPKSYDGRIVNSTDALPDIINSTAFEELKESQPKYNTHLNGTPSEGFVIIKEPNARLGFETLLDIESAFYTEGELNNLIISPNQKNTIIFQNIILEIRGNECEENIIILQQPQFDKDGKIVEPPIEKKIKIKHESNSRIAPRIETTSHNNNEATLWINFNGDDSESLVSRHIEKYIIDYINSNNNIEFVAIDRNPEESVRLQEENEHRNLEDTFRSIEPEIASKDELWITGANRRIKIIYTGPLVLTYADIGEGIPPESNSLITDLADKKYYFSTIEGNQRTNSLFSTHPKCIATNGFGYKAKVTLQDTGKNKQGIGANGILGIRYVTEAGSTDVESDTPQNYTPMLQELRSFYKGRPISLGGGTAGKTSLGNITIKKKPHQIFFMAPSYYTGSITDPSWIKSKRYPFFEWNGKTSSPLYKMAMHNFLAETPKFFLKNRGMTTLVSKSADKFKNMIVGRTYYMDVAMYKTDGQDMTVSPYNGQIRTETHKEWVPDEVKGHGAMRAVPVTTVYDSRCQGRYFGGPYKYKNNELYKSSQELGEDPAYAPQTPPYFYGRTVGRISYTATKTNPTIDEIHAGMSIEYIDDGNEFIKAVTSDMGTQYTIDNEPFGIKDSPAYKARMQLGAAINFKSKTRKKHITYSVSDPTRAIFQPMQATDSTSKEDDVWVISTKFECPILNFNPLVTNNSASIDERDLTTPNNTNTRGTGMWHGYGKISDEGVFLSIQESFKTTFLTSQQQQARAAEGSPDQSRFDSGTFITPDGDIVGSLIDVCGFETGASKLGDVANETKVSEAVIMIPFVDTPVSFEKGATNEAPTISVINKNFFKINKETYDSQKTNIEEGSPAVATPEQKETSISRMIQLMKKYYIPPELDFLTYSDKNPFVMYLFEFNHTFDQEDLADIWQGVLPKIGTKAQRSNSEDDNEIVHNLGPHEFFGGRKLPSKIRWLTFKVKQKGEKNYYNITADSRDDERFKFNFNIGKKAPDYSYNWPYDFFSLVELANIEGGIIIESDEDK